MTTKPPLRALDITAMAKRRSAIRWYPNVSDPASASAALALTIALLRALRDRGVLSRAEVDDILSEAARRSEHGKIAPLVQQVRADLERADDE
jgi:hypothetical protein